MKKYIDKPLPITIAINHIVRSKSGAFLQKLRLFLISFIEMSPPGKTSIVNPTTIRAGPAKTTRLISLISRVIYVANENVIIPNDNVTKPIKIPAFIIFSILYFKYKTETDFKEVLI